MKQLLFIPLAVLLFTTTFAQSTDRTKKEIDPSKPTNLYTQINTSLEYQDQKSQNLMGLRVNVQYAVNPDNLFLVEIPLLNNDRTSKFGLADIRVRYFNVVKRNISKSFIAIAPFADISMPTGAFENGLGSSSWSLAGGVLMGFVASRKLAFFPGISYVHITKPGTNLIPEAAKYSSNGIGLQCNFSYKFDKRTFLAINPTPTFLNTNGNWNSTFTTDINFNKIIKPNKFKMNLGWNPNLTTGAQTMRLGATFFL